MSAAAKSCPHSPNEEWFIPQLLSRTCSAPYIEGEAPIENTQPRIFVLHPADRWQTGDEFGYHEVIRHVASGERCELFLVLDQICGIHRIARIARRTTLRRDPKFAGDMETSADLLRDLNSTHLVQVIANGMTKEEQPRPYVITERLMGRNLAIYLRRHGALDPSLTIEISVQVAKALSVLHRAGLTHPDLHPGALMLTHLAGDHFAIKLTGLDRIRRMSPVQVDGSCSDVQYDLLRFGILLRHLLLGRSAGIQADLSVLGEARNNLEPALAQLLCRLINPNKQLRSNSIDEVLEILRAIQASIAEASSVSMLRRRI